MLGGGEIHTPSVIRWTLSVGGAASCPAVYMHGSGVYTAVVGKHLIDIDEQALEQARVELGTSTIKDTVNGALRAATAQRKQRVTKALDALAAAPRDNRDDAWR